MLDKILAPFHNIWTDGFSDKSLPVARYPSVAQLLPYKFYDNSKALYINNNTIGFCFELSPLIGANKNSITSLSNLFGDIMPANAQIQVIHWQDPTTFEMLQNWAKPRFEIGGFYERMAYRRIEFLEDAGWHSLFKHQPFYLRTSRILLTGCMNINTNETIIHNFKNSVRSLLLANNFGLQEFMPREFCNFIRDVMFPQILPYCHNEEYDELNTISSQINDPAGIIAVDSDTIHLGQDIELQMLSIDSVPNYWSQTQNSELLGSPHQDIVRPIAPVLTSFAIDSSHSAKRLERAIADAATASHFAKNPIFARFTPNLEQKASEIDWVKRMANERGEKILETTYFIACYALRGDIINARSKMASIYTNKGFRVKFEKYDQFIKFLSCLPFMPAEGLMADNKKFGSVRSRTSSNCANLALLQGEWRGHLNFNPAGMLLFGRNGTPCYYNNFASNTNYSVAVIGDSGSGKSFFLQEMVSTITGGGGWVIIMDDGRSFENSCKLQGGQFIEFSAESRVCLNPFSLIRPKQGASHDEVQDYIATALDLITSVVKQMCRPTTKCSEIESAIISDCVLKTWQKYFNKGDMDKVREFMREYAYKDPRASDLATLIGKYCSDGLIPKYFNGQANIDVNSHVVVFELAELKKNRDLQQIVLMILMFLATERMYFSDRSTLKAILIDEAKQQFEGGDISAFVDGVARRSRKYGGCLITGTQLISDYFDSNSANSAYKNSNWTIFLQQKDPNETADKINADDALREALTNIRTVKGQYSECLIKGSDGWRIVRLIVDPWTAKAYSSTADDVSKIKQLVAQGYSLGQAIDWMAGYVK